MAEAARRIAGAAGAERAPGRPPESVLIVMLSALGDVVHALPVACALKRAWPETRITWVIQPVPYRLIKDHPAIDEFILFNRRRGVRGLGSFREIRGALKGRRFDLLIGLQVYLKAGLITAMADADVKLGFDRARARDLNWLFTNERIPARPTSHVEDQYFEFLRHLGVDPQPVEWGLSLTDEERRRQAEFFGPLRRPVCGVVVGTSKPEKNWAPERYARLLERLEAEHGIQPVLVGGPSAMERAAADAILASTGASPIDAMADDLRRLLLLLDGCDLVIAPDTGPLHIARAVDTPVVGLYGYTNPKRYGPWGKYGDLVVDGYARTPDEVYGPSLEYRPDGMSRITVDAVMAKVGRAMERYVGTDADADAAPGSEAGAGPSAAAGG